MTPSSASPPLLRAAGIGKRFPGVVALEGVSFDVGIGEIHALVGENGAGKSTLIKVIAGVYAPDDGQLEIDGAPVNITSPHHAQLLGISTIHQELALAPHLTVIENVFLGRELRRRVLGMPVRLLDEGAMERRVEKLARDFELDASDLHRPTGQLGALKQHVTEILKALAFDAQLVIMDEPTAALTDHEREALFAHMRSMREAGISILWVTHRIEELIGLAGKASVLRDGRYVGTVDPADVGVGGLIRMMVGREVKSLAEISHVSNGSTNGAADIDEVLGFTACRAETCCTTSTSRYAVVRSSASQASRVRGGPSWRGRSSARTTVMPARFASKGEPWASPRRATRTGTASRWCRRSGRCRAFSASSPSPRTSPWRRCVAFCGRAS